MIASWEFETIGHRRQGLPVPAAQVGRFAQPSSGDLGSAWAGVYATHCHRSTGAGCARSVRARSRLRRAIYYLGGQHRLLRSPFRATYHRCAATPPLLRCPASFPYLRTPAPAQSISTSMRTRGDDAEAAGHRRATEHATLTSCCTVRLASGPAPRRLGPRR